MAVFTNHNVKDASALQINKDAADEINSGFKAVQSEADCVLRRFRKEIIDPVKGKITGIFNMDKGGKMSIVKSKDLAVRGVASGYAVIFPL